MKVASENNVSFKAITHNSNLHNIEKALLETSFPDKNLGSNVELVNLFSCDLCNFESEVQSDLEKHKVLGTHTAEMHEIYTCEHCGLAFKVEATLETHIMNTHTENKLTKENNYQS